MAAMEDDDRLKSEIWTSLYKIFLAEHERHLETTTEFGVSPGDLKALLRLSGDRGEPMRALAETWRCDASTVTWVVDRLEKQGLVERRPHESDRRVKVVVLSESGRRLKTRVNELFYEPPAALSELSSDDLTALHRISTRLRPED